jgi:hypothetical protein
VEKSGDWLDLCEHTKVVVKTGTHRVSERLDRGLWLEQNGNPVPNWVNALALVALQTLFTAQHEWLAADRAGEYFKKLG